MKKKQSYNYIDLFAGAGGLSLGFFNAGFKGIFAVEKNKDAFRTLKHNLIDKDHFDWPEWLTVENHDIDDLIIGNAEKLKDLNGKIDLVVGGPPCQGFSMAGKREHSDIRNQMVDRYIRFVELVKPKYICLENVHGIAIEFKVGNEKIRYSTIVKNRLEELGYQVTSKEVVISNYGVPQARKRFILIGSLKNNISNFFNKLDANANSFLQARNLDRKTTIADAISDLFQDNGTKKCEDSKSKFQSGKYGEAKSAYQKLMRKENALQYPDSHRFANHNKQVLEMHNYMINNIEKGKRFTPKDGVIPNLKRRGVTVLDPKGVSPTVTSHPDDMIHYKEPRILSVRELARIQSFPDWYEFKGKYTTGGQLRKVDVPRYTQVGNAVPPLFAEQLALVFKEIINSYE